MPEKENFLKNNIMGCVGILISILGIAVFVPFTAYLDYFYAALSSTLIEIAAIITGVFARKINTSKVPGLIAVIIGLAGIVLTLGSFAALLWVYAVD